MRVGLAQQGSCDQSRNQLEQYGNTMMSIFSALRDMPVCFTMASKWSGMGRAAQKLASVLSSCQPTHSIGISSASQGIRQGLQMKAMVMPCGVPASSMVRHP